MKALNIKDSAKKELSEKILPTTEVTKESPVVPSSTPVIKKSLNTIIVENKIIILIASASILVSTLCAFYLYFFVFMLPPDPSQIIKLNGQYVESGISNNEVLVSDISTPTVPKTEVNPLNGTLFTKEEMDKLLKRRPVAVMINNHMEARPQSGLNQADIVYEAVTESGITRYMAIFWSQGPNKVGPVRSARQYFLEWLSPFDPIYIHDGCAQTTDPRTNACGNIYTYKIKDITTQGSWRSTDRVAPHNEYNSIVNAWEIGKSKDWDQFPEKTEALKFKRDANFELRGKKTKVEITYRTDMLNGGAFNTQWVYDRNTNLYTHRVGGTTDVDLDTKKVITAKNVIVEEAELIDAFDGKGRVIITTTGQGKAKILMDGKIIDAKWKKSSRTDRTRYYDSKGEEILLNRGKIWVNSLPKDKGKFAIIEQ
jgi:hypothetical protein